MLDLIKVTIKMIEAGQSEKGGWTKAQLALIGVDWPPEKGWKKRANRRFITNKNADKFLQQTKGL